MKQDLKVSFFLASKTIQRTSKKTLLFAILMISLIVVNLILLPSLLDNMDEAVTNQVIYKKLGHVVLNPKDGETTIPDYKSIIKKLESYPDVHSVSMYSKIGANGIFNGIQRSVLVSFVDPELEIISKTVHEDMVEGEYLSPLTKDEIIVGNEVAGTYDALFYDESFKGMQTGDRLNLTFTSGYSKEYKVKGIYVTKYLDIDMATYVNAKDYEEIFGQEFSPTSIHVRLIKDGIEHDFIRKLKQDGFNQEIAVSRETTGIALTDTVKIIKIITIIVSLLVSFITLTIITYISIINKKKIIGIIKAIGINKNIIKLSFILQNLFTVILGVILGVILLYAFAVPYFQAHPLNFPFSLVMLDVKIKYITMNIIALILVSIVAALASVRGIVNKNIVEILR